jgi:hypothetical protein
MACLPFWSANPLWTYLPPGSPLWAMRLPAQRDHYAMMELEFFLRPTVSLGIGPPLGTLDQILSCSSFFIWQLRYSSFKAPSLTRKRVCSLQCNHSLVRSLTPNSHTLLSHLRLCSLFVSSYDSQGLRWKYSNPPPPCHDRFFVDFIYSTDGARSRHIIGFIYSPFLYIGVRDLVCWCHFVVTQP